MATFTPAADTKAKIAPFKGIRDYPASSYKFDLALALLSLWFTFGLLLDGWAHNQGFVDDSFFTPWHAVMYSGAFSVALVMAFTHMRNVLKGHAITHALPKGYFIALIGSTIFFVGGIGDLIWHTLLGIEVGVEALISTSHITLAVGAILFTSGPLWSAWNRRNAELGTSRFALVPAILSLTVVLTVLTFFTMYANPFSNAELIPLHSQPSRETYYVMSVATVISFLIPAGLMMGVLLLVLRRWALPAGAIAFMIVVNAAGMIWLRISHIQQIAPALFAAALIGGIFADVLAQKLKPSPKNPGALRWFSFLVPLTYSMLIVVAIMLTAGTWWRVHTWFGVPFLAGGVGLLLSFLVAPPALPDGEIER